MRFVPRLNREELEQLRVHKGDVVIVDGNRYIAREVGLKYASLSTLYGKPVPGLINLRYVRKLDEAEAPKSPLDDYSSTVEFDPGDLMKRR